MQTYLCNHHVAIKGTPLSRSSWLWDVRANLGDDGVAKGHIGHEMAVHNVDMKPVGAAVHGGCTFLAELGEVCAEDGGRNDCWRGHGGRYARSCVLVMA